LDFAEKDTRMRRILVTLIAAAFTATGLVVVAPPASATHDCVNKKEYKRVKKGMSKSRVHRIFDINGKQVSTGYGYEYRDYRVCTDPKCGFVSVTFHKKKLDSKYAYWG